MSVYPYWSHILAAILGYVLNSYFLGMHIVALLFISITWLSIFLILNTLSAPIKIISYIVLSMLVVFNYFVLRVDIHGYEIVNNYFYAQLVGQGALFLLMLVSIFIERRYGQMPAVLLCVASALVITSIHLLPAIEMLGLGAGLLACYVLFNYNKNHGFFKRLVFSASVLVIGVLSFVDRPSFSAMRHISENNGGLTLNHFGYPGGVLLLCLLVAFLSAAVFLVWWRSANRVGAVALKYIATYGMAVVALCMLQLVLTHYGQGSEYAVKKYGFGLSTVLFIDVAILSAYVIRALLPGFPAGSALWDIGTLILCFSLALFWLLPEKKTQDVASIVAAERQIIALNETVIPRSSGNDMNIIKGILGVPPVFEYMLSNSILRTPRVDAVNFYFSHGKEEYYKFNYVVSDPSLQNGSTGVSACASLSPGPLAVYPADCLDRAQRTIRECRQGLTFNDESFIPPVMIDGFGEPERFGRWTVGNKAHIRCSNSGAPVEKMTLVLNPFFFNGLTRQRLLVSLNGTQIGSYELNSGTPNPPITIEIPKSLTDANNVFEFETPDAQSPASLQPGNQDGRHLAFGFVKVMFQ